MSSVASTFQSHEPALHELLDGIHKGLVQLPDFQRGWVWDDEHIRSLIASVSLSYPIGVVMLLETGGEGVRFKPRPVEGVSLPVPVPPQKLILDGQQRLTSLYMVLRCGTPVPTRTAKGANIDRVYYLDMTKCLDEDAERLDAVLSLPPTRMLKSNFDRTIDLDVSSRDKEYENGLVPLDIFFDMIAYNTWKAGYLQRFSGDAARFKLLFDFDAQVWQRFFQYRIPIIELVKSTPKEAVCQVFEKVNTGGVVLTVFELVTATFAADDFSLRDDWAKRKERLSEFDQLADLESSDFLMAVTLLTTYRRNLAGKGAVSCKRKDVLGLQLHDYKQTADAVERSYVCAAKLLAREKVYDTRTLPYQSQLIPLASICAVLGDRFEQDSVKRKLARWYWCGVFGELYGGSNEARFANDIQDVPAWLDGGEEPRTIRDANFTPTRLLSMQTRLSAAYKGVMAKLMQVGSSDFLSGDPVELNNYFDTAIDIHHIFPKAYCEKQKYEPKFWNSVVNKAPLSAKTNRAIGGHAPSVYLAGLVRSEGVAIEKLDRILKSHLIAADLLRSDNFKDFIRDRACRVLDLIEQAMGKPVAGRDSEEVVKTFGGPLTWPPPAISSRTTEKNS
jgi:hypothetical protein